MPKILNIFDRLCQLNLEWFLFTSPTEFQMNHDLECPNHKGLTTAKVVEFTLLSYVLRNKDKDMLL